jgi:nicotinamidase-related amidase
LLGENRSERAMIILDMTNEIAHPEGSKYEPTTVDIIPYLQGELTYFRERMRPVIFCYTLPTHHADQSIEVVDFNAKIVHPLSPRSKEICIVKQRPNAFFKTDLIDVLQNLRVRNLTIVGAMAHTSVLTTAASALDYGFSVVVPETCVCSGNPHDQAAALCLINTWVSGYYSA